MAGKKTTKSAPPPGKIICLMIDAFIYLLTQWIGYFSGGTLSVPYTSLSVVPKVRIELTTLASSGRRSTTELLRHIESDS